MQLWAQRWSWIFHILQCLGALCEVRYPILFRYEVINFHSVYEITKNKIKYWRRYGAYSSIRQHSAMRAVWRQHQLFFVLNHGAHCSIKAWKRPLVSGGDLMPEQRSFVCTVVASFWSIDPPYLHIPMTSSVTWHVVSYTACDMHCITKRRRHRWRNVPVVLCRCRNTNM